MDYNKTLQKCQEFVESNKDNEEIVTKSGSPVAMAYFCAKSFLHTDQDKSYMFQDRDQKVVTTALKKAGVV